MKIQALWVTAVLLALAACSKQEPAEPQQTETAPDTSPPVEEATPDKVAFDQGFVDHMHAHAEQLDDLMFALADGNLDAAATPAYWLSRHDSVLGVPNEWQPYISDIREAASAIEGAADLEVARAAAEDISAQCQGCHTAAGVNVPG